MTATLMFNESHPVKDDYVVQMPRAPKLDMKILASLVLTGETHKVEITDDMRTEHALRYEMMQNERQVQGRNAEVMWRRGMHIWAEDAFTYSYPSFKKNPLACAKFFDKRNFDTQMPDVFHTGSNTRIEIKVLNAGHDGYAFHPELQPSAGRHPELIEYYIIVRGVFTATHYFVKPIHIFPHGLIYRPPYGSPTRYTYEFSMENVDPRRRVMRKIDMEAALHDNLIIVADDTSPINVEGMIHVE